MKFNINEIQNYGERKKNKNLTSNPIYKNELRDSLINYKNSFEKSFFSKDNSIEKEKIKNIFNNRRNNYSYSLENTKNIIPKSNNNIIKVKNEESLYILLKSKEENSYFINKTFKDKNILNIIKIIIQKEEKDNKDKYILVLFLKNLPHILDNISLSKYSMDSLISLLINIGINLKTIEFEEGVFLFHIDDIGKEFYIILSGEVSVLLPKFYKVQMNESEYLSHLIFLLKLNEKRLFINTLKKNNKIFSITELFVKEKAKKYIDIPNPKIPLDIYLSYLNGEKKVNIKEKIKTSTHNVKEVNICGYYKITELKEGNCFGEVALKNENSLRTASVFTNTLCSFAFLDVENYNMTLKNIQRKTRLENINFLLKVGIFNGLNEENFENKYWPLFCSRVISKGEIMFYNGENYKDEIIFIKTGEFFLETKLNINKFNEIINYLKLKSTKYKKKILNDIFNIEANKKIKNNNIFELKEEDDNIIKYQIEKSKKNKLNIITESMVKDNKIDVNIGYLSNGEILGLDNMIYEGKYFCTAKCISEKCEFFSLQKQYFDKIISKFPFLQRNMHKFILLKKEFMYQTFLKVKNNIIKNKKLNLIEPDKSKKKIRDNLKILTNISLNLYQKNFIRKNLLKNKKLKFNESNKSINNHFLSVENKNNKQNDFSLSECTENSINKKQRIIRINSSISLNLNKNNIFKEKKKKFNSSNKEITNFPIIDKNNNNFYNNVVFGYKNKHVILNKAKLRNLNLKYLSLLNNSSYKLKNKHFKQKFLKNQKYSSIFHSYDFLIYEKINQNNKEKNFHSTDNINDIFPINIVNKSNNKMKKNRSEFMKTPYNESDFKNIPIMYLLKPNYKLTKKIYSN